MLKLINSVFVKRWHATQLDSGGLGPKETSALAARDL